MDGPASLLRRALRFTAWPIAAKLSAALLLCALVPMAITTALDVRLARERAELAEMVSLTMLAQSTAGRLAQLLEDTRRVVSQVAGDAEVIAYLDADPDQRDHLAATVKQTLGNVQAANQDIALAFLLDARGRCIVSTHPEEIGRDFSHREYYREAFSGAGYVSEILTGVTTQKAGVYFSQAVRDRTRGVVGVAVLKLSGDAVQRMVSAVHPTGGGAFLVDGYGVIVSHSEPAGPRSLLYKSLAALPDEVMEAPAMKQRFISIGIEHIEGLGLDPLASQVVRAAAAGSASFAVGQEPPQIAGFAPVVTKQWTLLVYEPAATLRAPLAQVTYRTALNAMLVGAAVTLLALGVARQIVRPLRKLTDAARAVQRGDFANAHVGARSEDELGTLGDAFDTMAQGLAERQRVLEIFGRIVSPEVREKLLRGQLSLGGETVGAVVLFSDIRGFSTMAETMDPQAVVAMINEYLTVMSAATSQFAGYINNFIGDAIVVIFGAPIPQRDAEKRAVLAALAMRDALADLNQRRTARGEPALETGIGIAAGDMVAGQIGSPERMLYTVIGDAVNVAARLEALTKDYPDKPILITKRIAEAIVQDEGAPAPATEALGPIKLKGRSEPVEVFAVVK